MDILNLPNLTVLDYQENEHDIIVNADPVGSPKYCHFCSLDLRIYNLTSLGHATAAIRPG